MEFHQTTIKQIASAGTPAKLGNILMIPKDNVMTVPRVFSAINHSKQPAMVALQENTKMKKQSLTANLVRLGNTMMQ
jgi:hypothetical protein